MDSIGKRFGTVSNTERFQPLAAEVTTQTSKRLDRACHQTSPLCHKRVTNVYNKNSSSKNMTKTRGQTHLGAGRRRHVSLISTQSKSIEIRLFGLYVPRARCNQEFKLYISNGHHLELSRALDRHKGVVGQPGHQGKDFSEQAWWT